MSRQLPPLNALRAFEAAARSESVTRGAEELCVTQGAVSHQVKALEATLGIKLFNRERQRLVITDAGREYLNVVRDALDRIAAGTERVLQRQNSGVLTVSTSPDFAAKWLVYRLGRFAEAHPGRPASVITSRWRSRLKSLMPKPDRAGCGVPSLMLSPTRPASGYAICLSLASGSRTRSARESALPQRTDVGFSAPQHPLVRNARMILTWRFI